MIKHPVPVVILMLLAGTASAAPATQPSGVSLADQLQFQENNVAAQMQELQERMYRLGELTREAEPRCGIPG